MKNVNRSALRTFVSHPFSLHVSPLCLLIRTTLLIICVLALTGCTGKRDSQTPPEILPAPSVLTVDPPSDLPPREDTSPISATVSADLPPQDATHPRDTTQSSPRSSTQTPSQPLDPFVDKLTPEAKGWGLSFGEAGTQPIGNASPEELQQYNAYFIGDAEEKTIYLTFDCGYENGNTEAILDALKKHKAPATFFVVGHYLESAPELVCRMTQEGHTVGSHTYHHPDINTLKDKNAFQSEMDALREKYTQVTGGELAMYYRPPEGKCGITNLKLAKELGYSTFLWSLAYVDWDTENQPSHEEAFEKLTKRIHPGAVVLLHNTSQTNGEILDELLTKWEDLGYRFAPLSELTSAFGH